MFKYKALQMFDRKLNICELFSLAFSCVSG